MSASRKSAPETPPNGQPRDRAKPTHDDLELSGDKREGLRAAYRFIERIAARVGGDPDDGSSVE